MDKELLNISKIETFFNSLLDGKVSDNTFFTEMPATLKSTWADVVVVDIVSMADLNAAGQCRVNVFLYAKPKSNGTKNVPVLSKMETALNESVMSNDDKHYKLLSTGNKYTDYDASRDLHCNIIEFNLLII